MKNFVFLFDNILVFYFVAGAVILNAILGIYMAIKDKKFSWGQSTDFIRLMGIYAIWLMLGNAVDYFTKLQGYELAFVGLEITGFKVISSSIVVKEVGKVILKLKRLAPIANDPPIPPQQ